jgi:hypothetical protein
MNKSEINEEKLCQLKTGGKSPEEVMREAFGGDAVMDAMAESLRDREKSNPNGRTV